MSEKDGGPAFPEPFSGHCGNEDHAQSCGCYMDSGMTLRDYFAIRFATAFMGAAGFEYNTEVSKLTNHAYVLADAMIAARNGTKT